MAFKIYLTETKNKWLKRKDGSGLLIKVAPNAEHEFLLYEEDFGPEPPYLGRILFDSDTNWVYDGQALTVFEEEQVAAFITGNHKETDELIKG